MSEVTTPPVCVSVRDNRADGAALLRIALEVRDVVCGDCSACRERVPRKLVWGTESSSYVHWYPGSDGPQSTCAPCPNDVVPEVFADLDRVAAIGAWLSATTPIVLPITLPTGPALLLGDAVVSATASAPELTR